MKCLRCAVEIPASFLADLVKNHEARISLFNCPKCHAAHLQRVLERRADGKPVYQIRLMDHLATTRGGQPGVGNVGRR